MLRVVVINLEVNEPGKCYTGFTDRDHIMNWLAENGYMDDRWRWIIFNELHTSHI